MKRLIAYDLDGTLVDTLEDIAASANHMLDQIGRPRISRDQVRRYVGRGVYQLVKDCLDSDDHQRIEDGLKIYRAHYRQHMLDHTALYPRAVEVLEHFHSRVQVVITNKPNPYSREILEALGVDRYFLDIIAGDSPYPKKPDPSSLRALMQRVGASAAQTLFIGDSPVDIEAGRAAGVETVVVLHGLADMDELRAGSPSAIARDFTELLDLARRKEW